MSLDLNGVSLITGIRSALYLKCSKFLQLLPQVKFQSYSINHLDPQELEIN